MINSNTTYRTTLWSITNYNMTSNGYMTSNDSRRDACLSTNPIWSTENVLYSIFMGLVLAFSVGGNSIVILALLMSNTLKKRSTFFFVASLGELAN